MFDARNIAKPLTPSKSKKDEVLYWPQILALSHDKRPCAPKRSAKRAKRKRKVRPIHDTNTVTLRFTAGQARAVQCPQSSFTS